MLSTHSVEPLPVPDRLPFPTSSPRPSPQPLDVSIDQSPSPAHDDTPTLPPQSSPTNLSVSEQVLSFMSTSVALVNQNLPDNLYFRLPQNIPLGHPLS